MQFVADDLDVGPQARRCCAPRFAQHLLAEAVVLPYAAKIKASGADAVLTGNWGNDLTLLIKAAREAGVDASFYTFYGNALGAPAAIGEAGVGRLLAVAEWHPNVGTASSERFYADFQQRFTSPRDDYVHARMQAMVEMLAAAIERARTTETPAIARALEGITWIHGAGGVHQGRCAPPITSSSSRLRERDGRRAGSRDGARQ